MTRVLQAVQGIVDPRRVLVPPFELTEEAERSRCAPIPVRYLGESWALRLQDGDHLPVLAELAKERSVRRLPDYLVFSVSLKPEDECIQVLVCELKSGAAGADAALPQVQLGKLLAEYLVRIAVHSLGETQAPKTWCCGLIASPQFSSSLMTKGRTRPGKVEPPNFFDRLSSMRIYQVPGGGEVRLESIY